MTRPTSLATALAVLRVALALHLPSAAGCGGGEDMSLDTACLSTVSLPGQTKLINCSRGVSSLFGMGVALSHDGRTALVSTPAAISSATPESLKGAALFFIRDDDGVWLRQQAIIQDIECTGVHSFNLSCSGGFGIPVGLSSDANVALIGSLYTSEVFHFPTRLASIGNVFVRDAGGPWISSKHQFGMELPNETTQVIDHWFALSQDGNTVLASASGTSNHAGAFWLDRSGYQPLNATSQLERVALSGDGNTALLGSSGTLMSSVNGSAYVFVRDPQGNWTQQQRLTAGDAAVADRFGSAVALSADGKTVLVTSRVRGAPAAAYVFERSSGGAWFQTQKMLLDSKAAGDVVATEAALSQDGATALISTVVDTGVSEYSGLVSWYVKEPPGTYVKRSELVAYDSVRGDQFGVAVALSGDGHTALIGAPNAFGPASFSSGAAYLFSLE